MRYMRCKCGESTCWTSMGHPPCAGCTDCNTTLAEGPEGHISPLPDHEIKVLYDVDPKTGETWWFIQCLVCLDRVDSRPTPGTKEGR